MRERETVCWVILEWGGDASHAVGERSTVSLLIATAFSCQGDRGKCEIQLFTCKPRSRTGRYWAVLQLIRLEVQYPSIARRVQAHGTAVGIA